MERQAWLDQLDREDGFHLRRAVERLREGLFDPVAVRLLTAHEDRLSRTLEAGFRVLDDGTSPHLCVVGAYGQGKSHSLTWIEERARQSGLVTSAINLDPREVPFHDLRQVYRALLETLRFPDGDTPLPLRWRAWAESRLKPQQDPLASLLEALPPELPPLLRAVLAAMALKTVSPEAGKKGSRRPPPHPRAVNAMLARALAGDALPAPPLKQALLARGVPPPSPFTLQGPDPWLQALRGLGRLLRQLGYRGWVLLFDEGESIAQLSLRSRSRAYQLLHRLIMPEAAVVGLYPVFAFTDDFFVKVQQEDYQKTSRRGGEEVPVFAQHYADAWRGLTRFPLQDLSTREWEGLTGRLLHLHARAYRWQPDEKGLREVLIGRLAEHRSMETRARLKALVEELDLAQEGKRA